VRPAYRVVSSAPRFVFPIRAFRAWFSEIQAEEAHIARASAREYAGSAESGTACSVETASMNRSPRARNSAPAEAPESHDLRAAARPATKPIAASSRWPTRRSLWQPSAESQFGITLVLNWTGAAKREARVATATFNRPAAHHDELSGLTSRG
jgi:hypothetical protein